jgi:glycosyltransferase involved in cell wall biosynthesis
MRSFRALDQLLQGRPVAVLHSNTLAVLSGAFWARRRGVAHVWHVHEIITHPRFVKAIYGYLLKWFADRIICISRATQDNLVDSQPALAGRCRLVWNGLSRAIPVDRDAVAAYRRSLSVQDGEVLLTLVGRINRWKGQLLLVEAAGRLWARGVRNFRVVIVGSVVPGQEHFLHALQQAITASPAAARITVQPFTNDVWTVWDSCDVAVIPSIEPEPFGMVALEAMAAAKPVVASNHGGLTEIVIAGQTGWLVPPCDADALADALEQAVTRPELRHSLGQAGQARHQAKFTLDRQLTLMAAVYDELVA